MVLELQKGSLISTTASVRNTFIHDPDDRVIVCAEPSPDAGFTQNQSGSTTFALVSTGGSDAISESEGSAEEEMSGRVPSILLARELLFRLCEFSRNHNLDEPTVLGLYKQNLNIIQNVSSTVAAGTTVNISDTVTNSTTLGISEATGALNKDTAPFTGDQLKSICSDDSTSYYNSDACKPYQ